MSIRRSTTLLVSLLLVLPPACAAAERPNILWLTAEDIGSME